MTSFPPAVLAHFARRHGIAAHHELPAAGLTRHRIHALCHAENLTPVLEGVYRIPAVPFDHLARCAAVCAAHPDASIAGPTAGRLWNFRRLPADRRIHVISSPHSQPTIESWVVPYRTAAIRDEDRICRDDGIVVTSRARTALDLSRQLRTDLDLLSVIEQAMRDGGLTDADMRATAVDYLSPRRPWLTRYLLALNGRLRGGTADSHHEVGLGTALSAAGLAGIERQYRIDPRALALHVSTWPFQRCVGRSKSTCSRLMSKPWAGDQIDCVTKRPRPSVGMSPGSSSRSSDRSSLRPLRTSAVSSIAAAPPADGTSLPVSLRRRGGDGDSPDRAVEGSGPT